MITSKLNTQSPEERRAAEAELNRLLAAFAPVHKRLVDAARRRLRKLMPAAHEVVYEYKDAIVISYSPTGRGYEGVIGIRASAEAVRLFFNRGPELPDPAKLLRGSGKQTRWIPVDGAATLTRPEVAELIDQALARNPVPFASDGRGPLVIRSASGK